MSTQFGQTVDQYVERLREFAEGEYLRPEERERWDQPFDPVVLPDSRRILLQLVAQLDEAPRPASTADLEPIFRAAVARLQDFNEAHASAVLEPEEYAELNELFARMAKACGMADEELGELPQLEGR